MAPRALPILLLALVGACRERPHPWEDSPAVSAGAGPQTPAPPQSGGSLLGDASTLLESGGDTPHPGSGAPHPGPAGDATGPGELDAAPGLPVRIGGPWVRCYGNFHPSGEPVKDVTRLGLLCGPENGMVRLSNKPIEGVVSAGAPPPPPVAFAAVRGDCYRVFAVAEPSVGDLDVSVRSSRGAPIAADHGEDRWPIVQPDRPFCALEDDTLTVEFTARRGTGGFAAEIWRLGSVRP